MRPRVFPAEDGSRTDAEERTESASMRPRVFPAEDPAKCRPRPWQCRCFNEAAGIPRGRQRPHRLRRGEHHRFNEAAGIPRGRRGYMNCYRSMTS